MLRVFVDNLPSSGGIITLNAEEARYVHSVLRMRSGTGLVIVDASGATHKAELISITKGHAEARVLSTELPTPEPEHGIVLVQGMLKGQKMDLVVQKAVELGVRRIVPVVAERSQVRETRKTSRWQTIAKEAARQCGRTSVPEVATPVELPEFFSSLAASADGFIFWEEGGEELSAEAMPPAGRDIHVAVGPEGGFTAEEVEAAKEAGFRVMTLGPRILRAETAAIAGVTLVQYLMGRMGSTSCS